MQTATKHIEFTKTNVDLCMCMQCPVQAPSACAGGKMEAYEGTMASEPRPGDVPKVYCSQGTTDCGDLDFEKQCICPTCQVWQSNGLESYKYCRDGDASKIG